MAKQRKNPFKTSKISETITENIFRNFYGSNTFIEKSAIPKSYGFISKKGTSYEGFPDFFIDMNDFVIVVEAKALKHSDAEEEVKFYMQNNTITKGIVGIAISGQDVSQIKVSYFFLRNNNIEMFQVKDKLLSLKNIQSTYFKKINGETISDDELNKLLKSLNERFHEDSKVRDTDRSLFFSGILIALRNDNFRANYKNIQSPSSTEIATTNLTLLESHHLNKFLLDAIDIELKGKVNNLSKEFSWKDRFSFISNIDFGLNDYKNIIQIIEKKIYGPFINDEKKDILGKAYRIFLSRTSNKSENKNIILTPDHIKSLMVKLARLDNNDVVLDTCMGTGGFLMEALEVLTNYAGDNIEQVEHICTEQLIGFEIDPVLFSLACSNMFLHGDGRSNLIYRSSLLNDKTQVLASKDYSHNNDKILLDYIKSKKPTKCIINPPYEKDNPIKFVNQALDYLEQNGKLIIIMPSPTLTKHQEDGSTERILSIAKLDFVIKMPYNLFREQGRTVNTSIFGFTKTPHHKDDYVLFYNLESDGLVSVQHKGRVDLHNLWNDLENTIIDAINNKREISGQSELRKIYKNNMLNCTGWRDIRSSKHELVKFGKIFTTQKGYLQSSKNSDQGNYDFITASSERKKHDEYTHECEALVYAIQAGGSLGKCQYVNGKFIASNLCLILTPNEQFKNQYPISLKFYNWYLEAIRTRLVADLADGTSKLTIDENDLKNYYIEYIPLSEQLTFVEKYVKSFDELVIKLSDAEYSLKSQLQNIL